MRGYGGCFTRSSPKYDNTLRLELVDEEKLTAYRQAKEKLLKKRAVHICPICSVQRQLGDNSNDFFVCSYNTVNTVFEPQSNILMLHFADTTERFASNRFSSAQAERVSKFLERSDANDDLYVYCDSGISCSAAIAAAIIRAIGDDDCVFWWNARYHPNHYVF